MTNSHGCMGWDSEFPEPSQVFIHAFRTCTFYSSSIFDDVGIVQPLGPGCIRPRPDDIGVVGESDRDADEKDGNVYNISHAATKPVYITLQLGLFRAETKNNGLQGLETVTIHYINP